MLFADLRASTTMAAPWTGDAPPLGIGVPTGTAFVEIVGSKSGVTELAALGDAVNTTARITSARAGEVL